jgi:hypothetical protein
MLNTPFRSPASAEPTGGSASGPVVPDHGTPAPAAPGLDAEALARLAALDPTGRNRLVERVLKAFQSSAARLMPQLAQARQAGDRDAIKLVAHTLKSSSASIGAPALSALCAQIEAAIRLDPTRELDAEIGSMTEAVALTLQAIDRVLAEPGA